MTPRIDVYNKNVIVIINFLLIVRKNIVLTQCDLCNVKRYEKVSLLERECDSFRWKKEKTCVFNLWVWVLKAITQVWLKLQLVGQGFNLFTRIEVKKCLTARKKNNNEQS